MKQKIVRMCMYECEMFFTLFLVHRRESIYVFQRHLTIESIDTYGFGFFSVRYEYILYISV